MALGDEVVQVSQQVRDLVLGYAMGGSDADLPEKDRRARARIDPNFHVPAWTTVYVDGWSHLVLGPGRGEGWALLMWVEDDMIFYGTFPWQSIALAMLEPAPSP